MFSPEGTGGVVSDQFCTGIRITELKRLHTYKIGPWTKLFLDRALSGVWSTSKNKFPGFGETANGRWRKTKKILKGQVERKKEKVTEQLNNNRHLYKRSSYR